MQTSLLRMALVVGCVSAHELAWADGPCAKEAEAVAAAGRDPSLASPTEQAAADRVEAGNRAFRVQQYEKAIDEYTAAGLGTSAPVVLYDLGQALRASKQYEKAIRQYQLFLSRGTPGSELRGFIQCLIGTMKEELDAAASTAPPTGPAADGGTSAAVPAANGEPDLAPDGPTETTRSRWTGRRKIALVAAGAGVAAVGIGAVLGVRSNGFEDDAADICPMENCATEADAERANALVDKAESNATYANIAFGVGAAAVIGAVVLWITGTPPSAESTSAIVAPRVTRDAASVELRLRF